MFILYSIVWVVWCSSSRLYCVWACSVQCTLWVRCYFRRPQKYAASTVKPDFSFKNILPNMCIPFPPNTNHNNKFSSYYAQSTPVINCLYSIFGNPQHLRTTPHIQASGVEPHRISVTLIHHLFKHSSLARSTPDNQHTPLVNHSLRWCTRHDGHPIVGFFFSPLLNGS